MDGRLLSCALVLVISSYQETETDLGERELPISPSTSALTCPKVAVPAIGFSDPFLSHLSAFKNVLYSKGMLMKGYALHAGGIFKAPNTGGWHVYVCGPKLVEEICKLPDNVLDIQAAAKMVRNIANS